MKKLLVITALLLSVTIQAQSLDDVFNKYITPNSSTQELREGLKQIDELCSTNPVEKCNKAKAYAYYLLADNYYNAAYSIYFVDQELAAPVLQKAKELFDKANNLQPLNTFTEVQKNILLESKRKLEAHPEFKS